MPPPAAEAGSPAVPAEEIARILAPHPLFARFGRESLLAVAARFCVASHEAGATLMREGEPGSFAAVILDGEVDVFVALPTGPVQMATVGRNRVIGELGVFTDQPRTATVIARSDVVIARIERHSLMRLSAEYPSIAIAIIQELGGRLARMNRSLAYLTYAAEALGREEYDSAPLDTLTDLPGELASFGRAFAGMAREIRAKQNRRAEMRAAAEIQQSILPPPWTPTGPAGRVDLYAEMHPAREIGGDFYDYFPIDANRLAFTVADVSGKGIPAALFMAVSRTVMRSISGRSDLSAGISEANRLLATHNTASMFVTLFHGVLDLTTGVLRYCNAGHNPPYLLHADGTRSSLGATGIPIGIEDQLNYRTAEIVLAPGDTLFLFSDGITEAFDAAGNEFGTARLEQAVDAGRGRGAADLVREVLRATSAFTAGAEQSDDITCLALTLRGSPAEG
ncbi:MAG: PP2C family protein-serine/threonine phosphatase [Alphaproteobacteria bacterium]